MKKNIFKSTFTALTIAAMSSLQSLAQITNLVTDDEVDVSGLPTTALDFIKTHYRSQSITECEENYFEKTFDVELGDGTDLGFNSKGKCIDISAGRHKVLALEVVKHILPAIAYQELSLNNMTDKVEEISFNEKRGYKIEFRDINLDDVYFTPEGERIDKSK